MPVFGLVTESLQLGCCKGDSRTSTLAAPLRVWWRKADENQQEGNGLCKPSSGDNAFLVCECAASAGGWREQFYADKLGIGYSGNGEDAGSELGQPVGRVL